MHCLGVKIVIYEEPLVRSHNCAVCTPTMHVRPRSMHSTTNCLVPSTYIHETNTNCTNFHVPGSKIPEMRGSVACTCVARAQCTTTPKGMHHRIVFVELYQCTKFRVASSKFPESKGAYICIAHVHSTCTMHPITKWHSPSNYAH